MGEVGRVVRKGLPCSVAVFVLATRGRASNYDALIGMAKALAGSREITDPIIRECAWSVARNHR